METLEVLLAHVDDRKSVSNSKLVSQYVTQSVALPIVLIVIVVLGRRRVTWKDQPGSEPDSRASGGDGSRAASAAGEPATARVVDRQSVYGDTALTIAAARGHRLSVAALLRAEADETRVKERKTAWDWAGKELGNGRDELIEEFKERIGRLGLGKAHSVARTDEFRHRDSVVRAVRNAQRRLRHRAASMS